MIIIGPREKCLPTRTTSSFDGTYLSRDTYCKAPFVSGKNDTQCNHQGRGLPQAQGEECPFLFDTLPRDSRKGEEKTKRDPFKKNMSSEGPFSFVE